MPFRKSRQLTRTIVVATVSSQSERMSACTFPEVPEMVSPSMPTFPGLLKHRVEGSRPKREGEFGDPRKAMQGPEGKRTWIDVQLHHERTV